MILAIALLAGVLAFCVQFAFRAEKWVTFPGSPHLYKGSTLNCGTVTDANGTLILNTNDGKVFAQDAATRKAFLHLLGDRDGFIEAPLLSAYADQMIGYNLVNGLYGVKTGNSVAELTMDAVVQKTALEALNGRRGTVGVYNYKTGEILCAVTSPSFDPDNVPDIANDTTGRFEGVYLNRFFDVKYTPGSIFKILTSVAAIDTIPDIYQQKFTCEGSCIIGGQNIICEGTHHEIDFSEGLAHSCNCVFGNISDQLGRKTLEKYAKKAGLTESYSICGYRTPKGNIDLSHADAGDTAWAGIGQYSDQVNAYSFMRFMGILGGGGEAAEPYIMKTLTVDGQCVLTGEKKSTGQIFGTETMDKIATMLHYNVVSIYGESQFPQIYVCAKSGTAELEGQTANAMFAGFTRNDTYPLAFVVFIENAGSGSAAAAPVAARVLWACVNQMQK